MPYLLLPPDTEGTLQAVTAMALFGINIPGMQVDELIIEAARISMRMGCHRVIKKRDTDPVSCYKTFWVIYALERMLCFFYGRSPIIPDYDIGCPIPETPESNVEGFNFFVTALRGSRILSKAYQMLFSVSATMKSTEQYYASIDEIKSDLNRWTGSIPPKFRPGMPFHSGTSWMTFMSLRLHYMYHALVMSLCRLELHIGADADVLRINDTRKLLMDTARTIINLTTFIELKPYTPLWVLGTIPASAMFILFDFVVHNPSHAETDTNLRLLDTAAGYYGRLQYATGGTFPSMVMSGFAHIAADFVRRIRTEHDVPMSRPGGRQFQDMANIALPVPTPYDAPAPDVSNSTNMVTGTVCTSGPIFTVHSDITPEPLFYPVAEGDLFMNDDLLAGFNFTNFFDTTLPGFDAG
ncbi:hypothetical protein TruAng_005233 [Truncatella angustata]|nr:hypothetical protein TruAng_005233 [Truncatella angustata]